MNLSGALLLTFLCKMALGFDAEVKTYPRGIWDHNLMLRYFQAYANYPSSGNVFDRLTDGNAYKVTHLDYKLRTIMTRSYALSFATQVGSAESRSPGFILTNSGITKLATGMDFVLYDGPFRIIPELWFSYPMTRNILSSQTVGISEGAMEIGTRMQGQFDLSKLRNLLHLGFIYRDQGRSSLMPYGVLSELRLRTWSLGGELKGYSSISFDNDTNNDALRRAWASSANGGSYKYYQVNPSLLEMNLWAKFILSNSFLMQLGGGTTLNGANSAAGNTFFVGMLYRAGGTQPKASARQLERFQPETNDKVHQEYFAPDEPEESIEPEDSSDLRPKPDKTRVQTQKKSVKKNPKKGK